jgi:hypothetical protein
MIILAYIVAIVLALYAIMSNDVYYLVLSLIASAIAILLGKD